MRAIAVRESGIVSVVPAILVEIFVRLALARPDVISTDPERTSQ